MVAGRAGGVGRGGGGGGPEFNTYLFTAGPAQVYTFQPFPLHCNKKFIHAAGGHHGSRQNIRPYRTLRPDPCWHPRRDPCSPLLHQNPSFFAQLFCMNVGGGGDDEWTVWEPTHLAFWDEGGGGGGGKKLKGGHCFSKKISNLTWPKFFKEKIFEWHFCKFCPTLQIRGFLREYVKEKSNFYCRTGFKIELLPKTQLGHFFFFFYSVRQN